MGLIGGIDRLRTALGDGGHHDHGSDGNGPGFQARGARYAVAAADDPANRLRGWPGGEEVTSACGGNGRPAGFPSAWGSGSGRATTRRTR